MPQIESVVRLLIVEDRLEDAEGLISVLRNGGMAVRPQRPESLDELKSALASRQADLVLAAWGAKAIPFAEVIDAISASGKDTPVVATIEHIDDDLMMKVFEAGARSMAVRSRPAHLQMVVRNEFQALERRRALRRLEASLRETERRCDALIASSRDPIAYIHEGMHIRANEAYLEIFGYDGFDEIEGLSILDMVAPGHAADFKALLKKLSKGEAPPKSLNLQAQRADGEIFEAIMEFTQATYEGEPCIQIVFRKQEIDPEMVKQLDELRQRDQVTGLFNRQHFLAELETVVAEAADGRHDLTFLLVTPDNHAAMVSEIGLAHADELLKRTAERLQSVLDEHSIAARFSDHGFAVLATRHDHAQGMALSDRIRGAFQAGIVEVGERSLNLTVSIGGVQIGEKIASVQQILAKANQCLQASVAVGGNRTEIFDPAARDRAEEERIQAWVARIKAALRDDGFLLHYQPIISLQGEPGETYEAFLRMRVGNGEIAPPLSFLPIAEEYGLLDEIDRWVVGRAIDVLAERGKAGRDTTLFVKVTASTLGESRLADFIGERLKATGVPGERLVLEMAESKVFTNLKVAQDFLSAVSAFGCRIALEQFGSGLNSFQLLTHFDPAILKIDRSFMGELGKNPENQKRVKEIADRAREIGKLSVAEFVQDAASMTVLFSCGVDFVEGHFLAAAGPDMNYDFG